MALNVVLFLEASSETLIRQNILEMGFSRSCQTNHLGLAQVEHLF